MPVSGMSGNIGSIPKIETHTPAGGSAHELQTQFLNLLVTQLQNQDPLDPMDSVNFTSQLAQFSSLEQLTQVSSGLQALVAAQNSMQNAYLTNLIGNEVVYEVSSMFGSSETLQGTITGISYDSDGTYFIVDGSRKVAIGEIRQVMQPKA